MSRSLVIAAAALAISAGLHALGLAKSPAPTAPPSGGEAAQEVPLLGNDFANLAAGHTQPVTPERPQTPPRERLEPLTPERTTTATTVAAKPAAEPERPSARSPVPETLRAQTGLSPMHSPRPQARPAPPKPEQPKATQTAKARPKPATSGNAARDAKRGRAEGAKDRQQTRATGTPAKAPSNAKPSQSPQQYGIAVIRKIRATPKARGEGRGKAVVGFAIAANGRLSAVRILRSSGSANLDAAALDHVRRAAPFPPPPKAGLKFSFEFIARG